MDRISAPVIPRATTWARASGGATFHSSNGHDGLVNRPCHQHNHLAGMIDNIICVFMRFYIRQPDNTT